MNKQEHGLSYMEFIKGHFPGTPNVVHISRHQMTLLDVYPGLHKARYNVSRAYKRKIDGKWWIGHMEIRKGTIEPYVGVAWYRPVYTDMQVTNDTKEMPVWLL